MMKYIILILAGFLSACSTQPEQNERDEKIKERAAVEVQLFNDCMAQASKNGRSADDDVSDIIKACHDHAFFTSGRIVP